MVLARACLAVALLVTLVLALIPQPPQLGFEPSDKAQHLAAFALLGLLASIGYPRRPFATILCLALFGAAIEALQGIPALNRDPELLDLFADVVGAAVMVTLIGLLRRFARRPAMGNK